MFKILYGVVITVGSFYLARSIREWLLVLLLGAVLYLSFIAYINHPSFNLISVFANLSFFGYLFVRLLNYIFRSTSVDANSLYASVSAYLLLGLMGVPLCAAIEYYQPGAYSMQITSNVYDLMYYCFITITTVGYGDITPVHPLAKSLAMLLSISGQLYITFIVGIIIGKFLANETQGKKGTHL